jgi:peptide chain release factor
VAEIINKGNHIMSFFNVSPKKESELMGRMKRMGVSEDDIEERFSRSSGPGGQKTNKTSTCVSLLHIPTGITVKCQEERSQSLNRFLARRRLLDQIERSKKGFVAEEKKRIDKIRQQKRKRTKRAKEKILATKLKQSEEK